MAGSVKLKFGGQVGIAVTLSVSQVYDLADRIYLAVSQEYTVWETLLKSRYIVNNFIMPVAAKTERQEYSLTSNVIFRRTFFGGIMTNIYDIRYRLNTSYQQICFIDTVDHVTITKKQYAHVIGDAYLDIPEAAVYTSRIYLDGADVTARVKSCNISYSLEQFCGECSITWADWTMYDQLDPLLSRSQLRVQVITQFNDEPEVSQGQFFIERRTTNISPEGVVPSTWGRSKTSLLSKPHALPVTKIWTSDTTSNAIMFELMDYAPTVTVDWGIPNYRILGGNFTANEEYPIELIARLASTLGGILTTNKSGALVARLRYR